MAEQIEDVVDLQNWTVEQMTDIKDIGPVVAENVVDWFSRSENIEILERMRELGVNLKQTEKDRPVEVDEDAPLIGKSILFTGALQQMTRKEAQKIAEENGAKNISAVSSKLDILVVGEKAGSKLKKAQALGSVLIMTEEASSSTQHSAAVADAAKAAGSSAAVARTSSAPSIAKEKTRSLF